MREVFVDTNILIDLVIKREPFSTYAKSLFAVAEKKSIVMNICAISYNNVYYIIRKRLGREKAKTSLKMFSDTTKCLPVDHTVIHQAMMSQFRDFEDAIQYYCALQIPKCEAIITRNIKDFKLSAVSVKPPEEFWADEVDINPFNI